jgi:RNA polymerase sigma factor (sigma-70 family)
MGGALLVRTLDEPDHELLARVRSGDRSAYGLLWERYEAEARASARFLTRSRDEADDVVAEAFARVLRAIHGGAGPTEAFRPYLMTALRRTAWRRQEARRMESRLDGDTGLATDDEPPPEAIALDGEMARAFSCLSPRWQTVLWMAEVEGRTTAEIGAHLGLSANAAAALLGRARDGLRRAYGEATPSPAPLTVAA